MKMLTSIFLALFSLVLFATAQERKISGRVTDENGNPLASVSVSVKNGVKGGTTNEKGEYSMQKFFYSLPLILAVKKLPLAIKQM